MNSGKILLILLLLVTSNLVHSKNYYISSSGGNDSNSGTSISQPWRSLDKLNTSWTGILPGDSILFKRGDSFIPAVGTIPGSRYGCIAPPMGKSGTAGAYIVVGAYGTGALPVISAELVTGGWDDRRVAVCVPSNSYMIFQDLELVGGFCFDLMQSNFSGLTNLKLLRLYFNGSRAQGRIFFRVTETQLNPNPNPHYKVEDIEIAYCRMDRLGSEDAFNCLPGIDRFWIHHNVFTNTSEEAIDMAGGAGGLIEYNVISGNTVNGIKLHSQWSHLSNVTVRGNLVVHVGGMEQEASGGYCLAMENVSDCKIYNNTFFSSYAAFLGDMDRTGSEGYFGTFERNEIRNNIFDGTIQILGTFNDVINTIWDRNTFSNNIYAVSRNPSNAMFRFFDSSSSPIRSRDITPSNFSTTWVPKTSSTEISASPGFVNPSWIDAYSYGDYRLQSSSPGVGSGYNTLSYVSSSVPQAGAYVHDLDEKSISSPLDRGAFQKSSGGAAPTNYLLLSLRAALEGAYGSGAMRTDLLSQGLIPKAQPYNQAPFNYSGTESLGTVPDGTVDWVLVELRTALDTKVATRAALIKSNGMITDLDGSSPVKFQDLSAGNYYVIVRHRNHLPIMSAQKLSLSSTSLFYDFMLSASSAYGTNPMDQADGFFLMILGDANSDGKVTYSGKNNDRLALLAKLDGNTSSLLTSVYANEDINLNGAIKYSGTGTDGSLILQVLGGKLTGTRSTSVPK